MRQRQSNGRSQDCQARLKIGGNYYPGTTGNQHGHAEMDALHKFIEGTDAPTIKEAIRRCASLLKDEKTPKSVFCPSRPCCLKCSYVLKKLGFGLGTSSSYSETSMGSTEWGVSMNVRALLKECNIDYEKAKGLS